MTEKKRYDYKISDDGLEESIDISGFDEMVYFPNDVFTEKNVEKVVDKLNEQEQLILEQQILINTISDQRNEFHRGARENAHKVGQLEERIQEYEKLIKQILYETRANYTKRRYSICVSVSPQIHDKLNKLLENKMQEEF